MYYLRKEAFEEIIPEIHMTNGKVIPERKNIVEDRAIYKHPRLSRVFRRPFEGLDVKDQGMKVYTAKRLSTILKLRESVFRQCGELFDVYDENGIVDIPVDKENTIGDYVKLKPEVTYGMLELIVNPERWGILKNQ